MRSSYERLSAQDSSFLHFEHRATPMHVAAIAIFESGCLATADGGVDIARIAEHIEARLPQLPRYRRRLARMPVSGQPIWIDDARFSLGWHLRRAALPRPGSTQDLRELVGRILSQRLERSRPLWEVWIIEGLAGGRFALVAKTHHSLVDGVAGANLLTLLLDTSAQAPPTIRLPYRPASAPGPVELLLDEAARGLAGVGALLGAVRAGVRDPRAGLARAVTAGSAVAHALDAAVRRPEPTVLNGPIGPHRRIAWLALDLAAVKAVKQRLGGTVNDVVLAVVAGGLHRFFGPADAFPTRLDYRIVVPVNMRPPGDVQAANRVSAHFLSLPVAEPDPLRRYREIRARSERAKRSAAAQGIDLMTRLLDQLGAPWMTRFGVRLASGLHPYHLIVTNVPGPPMPLYLLGAPLVELYPHLPLFAHQGLGVAALSYGGKIGFGLIADYERVSELEALADSFTAAFAELQVASGTAAPMPGARSSRRSPGARAVHRERGPREAFSTA